MGPMPPIVDGKGSNSIATGLGENSFRSLRPNFAGRSDKDDVLDPAVLGACRFEEVAILSEMLLGSSRYDHLSETDLWDLAVIIGILRGNDLFYGNSQVSTRPVGRQEQYLWG